MMKRLQRSPLVLIALLLMYLVGGCETESTPDAGRGSESGVSPIVTGAQPSEADSEIPVGLQGMTEARAVRAVDGDTIIVELNGDTERVRYIGVDTPETVRPNSPVECYGNEASEANKGLVEGRTVFLEKDISERDRFDRLLRYVHVVQDGEPVFVNRWLVEQGYAQVSTFPPDVKYEQDYLDAQREARQDGRGLWGSCPVS